MPPEPSERLQLDDGRTLSWRAHGPDDGRVVVHHHGGLLSGAYASTAAATCRELGVRLVTPDRPGIGASTPRPGRTTADGAADVRQLLDHLGVERAGSLGWSMGGQYAIATAALLVDRIDRLVVVDGAVPLDAPGALDELNRMDRRLTGLAVDRPRTARATFRALGLVARRLPRAAARSMARGLSDADGAVVAALDAHVLAGAMAEAMAQPDGMAEEYRAWARPWGVPLAASAVPATVVRGSTDELIPEGWAARLATGLGAERDDVEGAGHLLLLTDWARVLRPFVG
jgi:pimeloyl-ACP methyl ester carboxylesterase